ncbi:MAG: bifunctional UDP-N-acetylglucosamine diphosphorylase/glucosamine-1-phosphate N-acetyltransferase GlmU [Alphaproteobacteria bacterium]|nr:bifunctional UDP-N-acetylglucosamine diphosphorylase/glucosamine-1-phosphate N-acetyltransferase GlmU [Alphaproteobacteria bacterium]
MKNHSFTAIVLAAGQGTRMKSSTPKVLHLLGHLPLIHHVDCLLEASNCQNRILVTAPSMESVREHFPQYHHAIQENPLGTGHAVRAAEPFIKDNEDVVILYGDVPFVAKDTLQAMMEEKASNAADIILLSMMPEDPGAYGRLIIDDEGFVERIVEYKDATEEEKEIPFCNSGILLTKGSLLKNLLKKISNKNAKKEYYLTDIIGIATQEGFKTLALDGAEEELMGVNSPEDLALAEALFQGYCRQKFLDQGVRFLDPDTTYFAYDTEIAEDVTIEPNVFCGPGVQIKKGAHVRAFSYLEGCTIGENTVVGPFARIRPGTVLEKNTRVGNFVELKNSTIGEGSKVPHLSYVGDATLGRKVNVGAGTITCNYDGYQKHKTTIGDNVFIGSNTSLIAPITIGDNAMVGAGSTLTQDVAKDSLALSRKEQSNIENGAQKFRAKHRKD